MSNIWVQEFEDGWLYVVNAEYTGALLSIISATRLSTSSALIPSTSELLSRITEIQKVHNRSQAGLQFILIL